jgi:transcriptional regulator with XRE-family HTH domain
VTTQSRRPIRAEERPYLLAMGAALKAARLHAGLTTRAVAERSQLDVRHLHRLERGERRTRASTLHRLVAVLGLDMAQRDVLLARLVAIAGPALAPESRFAWRVRGRRQRRARKRAKATIR